MTSQNRMASPAKTATALALDELFADEAYWAEVTANTIRDEYGGDALQYQMDADASLLETINWGRLIESVTILPELEQAGQNIINYLLGYLPHEACFIPHEPFIRALIQSRESGLLTVDEFERQAKETVKLIRNDDMTMCAYPYRLGVIARYDKFLPEQKEAARARLVRFLGYEPDMLDSLLAELWLRTILAKPDCPLPEEETAIDRRVMTIVKYREAYNVGYKEAADASPLLIDCRIPTTSQPEI